MDKKGMTIEECVSRAQEYISINGQCLLLFDMIGSRRYSDTNGLLKRLNAMRMDLNSRFSQYFPLSNINCLIRYEKGFEIPLGDASWAAINDSSVIPEIIQYQKSNYPDIPLRWGIARDGFDEEGTKIAK